MLLFYIKSSFFTNIYFCKKAVFLQLYNCKNTAFLHKKGAFLQGPFFYTTCICIYIYIYIFFFFFFLRFEAENVLKMFLNYMV